MWLKIFSILVVLISSTVSMAAPRPFKRVLVISGGGISPGIGLGVIAGLEAKGWKPDLIISACGQSMPAAIYNSYLKPKESLQFLQSEQFHNVLKKIKLNYTSLIDASDYFGALLNSRESQNFQSFFKGILDLDENLNQFLSRHEFNQGPGPRFIILGSKSPIFADGLTLIAPIFTETYFTDSDTAQYLMGRSSVIAQLFPDAFVSPDTLVLTDVTAEQAARASVAEPGLMNPARINGEYYMTGTVNLYPMELAKELGDEVIATYPLTIFEDHEDAAIKEAFGYSVRSRVLQTISAKQVQWVDLSGSIPLGFDPGISGIYLTSKLPEKLADFAKGVKAQYDFGFVRGLEAASLIQSSPYQLQHLRAPINPKLADAFICKNANVWKTPKNQFCENDFWPGCDRKKEKACVPIR